MAKSPDAFRTISEVATDLDVPQHVLRFWETKFTQIKPLKRAGGRRYYRPEDVDLLRGIRTLLYTDGFTIKGVQKVFRDQGVKIVSESGRARPANGAGKAVIRTTVAQIPVAQAPALSAERAAKPVAAAEGKEGSLETVLASLLEAKALLTRHKALQGAAPGTAEARTA